MSREHAVRVHLPARRLDASLCAGCQKKIHHPGPKDWLAIGAMIAIRCLDCRLAYCPRCAKRHFAPVRGGRMNQKCKEEAMTGLVRIPDETAS